VILHNIEIFQNGNAYALCLPGYMQIGVVVLRQDHNFSADSMALGDITQAIDARWNRTGRTLVGNQRVTKPIQRTFRGITIVQIDCVYLFYLPNQIPIGRITMPQDGMYVADAEVVEQIATVLAGRWGVKRLEVQKGRKRAK
jgi:hypothetical protein